MMDRICLTLILLSMLPFLLGWALVMVVHQTVVAIDEVWR